MHPSLENNVLLLLAMHSIRAGEDLGILRLLAKCYWLSVYHDSVVSFIAIEAYNKRLGLVQGTRHNV